MGLQGGEVSTVTQLILAALAGMIDHDEAVAVAYLESVKLQFDLASTTSGSQSPARKR